MEYAVPWLGALMRVVSRPRRPTLRDLDQASSYACEDVRKLVRDSRSSTTSTTASKSTSYRSGSTYSTPKSNPQYGRNFTGKPPYGVCGICQSPDHWWKQCPRLPQTGPPTRSKYSSTNGSIYSPNNFNQPPTTFQSPVTPTQATSTKFSRSQCCPEFNKSPWLCSGTDQATCPRKMYHRCYNCLDGATHAACDPNCPKNKSYKERAKKGF